MSETDRINRAMLQSLRDLEEGDEDGFLNELIASFVEGMPPMMSELAGYILAKKFSDAHKLAHKMKGRSANLGGVAFAAVCHDIEMLSDNPNDAPPLAKLLEAMQHEYDYMRDELVHHWRR